MTDQVSSLEGAPCCYCGIAMTRSGKPKQANYATKDHVVPVCAGGRGRETVRCCRTCNEDKCHLGLNEYRAVLCVRHRRPFVFYFERLAAHVAWLQLMTAAGMLAVSAGF